MTPGAQEENEIRSTQTTRNHGWYLADVLIKRRDKIGAAYLPKINPIVNPALDGGGVLTFGNAAVQAGFAKAPASSKAPGTPSTTRPAKPPA